MLVNILLFPRICEVKESVPHTEKIALSIKDREELGCSESALSKVPSMMECQLD